MILPQLLCSRSPCCQGITVWTLGSTLSAHTVNKLSAGTYTIHNSCNLYHQYQLSFISERKEGEEAPVESQGKKKKNLQFQSKGKIRSNALFVATAAAAQEPSLERSLACSRARSTSSVVHHCSSVLLGPNLDLLLFARTLSLLRPRSTTAPSFCWDPTLTYYYLHTIEPSD